MIVKHPLTDVPLEGALLERGDVLQPGDMYDSTTGEWEECSTPGVIIGDTVTLWVRPT